jgi:hypothetical protein
VGKDHRTRANIATALQLDHEPFAAAIDRRDLVVSTVDGLVASELLAPGGAQLSGLDANSSRTDQSRPLPRMKVAILLITRGAASLSRMSVPCADPGSRSSSLPRAEVARYSDRVSAANVV